MLGTFAHPLTDRSDTELSDYIAFCLNCRSYHRQKANQAPEGSTTRSLHIVLFRQFEGYAKAAEAVLRLRKLETDQEFLRFRQRIRVNEALGIFETVSKN